jgi:hypothetical protein
MNWYGFEVVADDRLRPGVIRIIEVWLRGIDWSWPERKHAEPPHRPFNHDKDRWCW